MSGNNRSVQSTLDTDRIRELVWRLAFPSMLAQFVNVLYSIVDRMYIGNIPDIGPAALAGAGVCGPIVTLISSFASWVGVGGAPLMSIRMGQKHMRAASRIVANCFVLLLGMAFLIMFLVFLLKDRLLAWFGASPAIFPYADTYHSEIARGTVFALLATGMNQFIICQGFAKTGMLSVVLGAVCNIALDPVFIFVLGMGVKGAAIATVISQNGFLCLCFGLPFQQKTCGADYVRLLPQEGDGSGAGGGAVSLPDYRYGQHSDHCHEYGDSAFWRKRTGGYAADLQYHCPELYAHDIHASGRNHRGNPDDYGLQLRGQAAGPDPEGIQACAAFGAGVHVLYVFHRPRCPGGFCADIYQGARVCETTVQAIRVYTMGIIPMTVQYTVVDGFTGMGIAKVAVSLSLFRKFIYFLGILFLPAVLGVGAVFYAEPLSDVVACVSSATVFLLLRRENFRR